MLEVMSYRALHMMFQFIPGFIDSETALTEKILIMEMHTMYSDSARTQQAMKGIGNVTNVIWPGLVTI